MLLRSLTLLLLAVARPAAGVQDSACVATVQAITHGRYIRVDHSRLGRLEGQFIIATDTTLTLTTHSAIVEVPLLELERLWVREYATKKGAVIGGGVGLVAGIATGLFVGSIACEPVDGGDCNLAEVGAVVGLIGGAGGALIGAAIGASTPVWRLRFP